MEVPKDSDPPSDESDAAGVETRPANYRQLLCFKLENWTLRKILLALFIGQVLSLLLCGTSVTSGLLSLRNVSIPTAQSLTNYALLAVVYTPWLTFRQSTEYDGFLTAMTERGWKYFLLAAIDVEGNYLFVKAYHYTSVTSVQLLDCFTIPVVLVLSRLILKVKYKLLHIVGVLVCLLGVGGLILADILTLNQGEDYHSVAGDLMVLGGSVLYAISNVAEEFVVKKFDMVEFLAMIGLFGTVISGLQVAVLERDELSVDFFNSYETVLLLVGFVLCLFVYYSLMPVMMKLTSAAVVNLSILSADFYALTVGLFLFKYTFHPLYFVAFVLIIIGVIVFCSKEAPRSQRSLELEAGSDIDREAALPVVRTEAPSCGLVCVVDDGPDDETRLVQTSANESTPLRTS